MKKQAGFTLIELVMVIVILGILAAVALPKFVDLGTDARKAAVQGIAGAIASAGTINYAQRSIGGTASGVQVTTATTCDSAFLATLLQAAPSANYNYATGAAASGVLNCSVTDAKDTAVSAVAAIPTIN